MELSWTMSKRNVEAMRGTGTKFLRSTLAVTERDRTRDNIVQARAVASVMVCKSSK